MDDLDSDMDDDTDTAIVDGLSGLLELCAELRAQRLARGLQLLEVAQRCGADLTAIEWVDDGDVAVPAETLVYYAAALGMTVRFAVEPVVAVP